MYWHPTTGSRQIHGSSFEELVAQLEPNQRLYVLLYYSGDAADCGVTDSFEAFTKADYERALRRKDDGIHTGHIEWYAVMPTPAWSSKYEPSDEAEQATLQDARRYGRTPHERLEDETRKFIEPYLSE